MRDIHTNVMYCIEKENELLREKLKLLRVIVIITPLFTYVYLACI